jgi:hypothetical protein
MRKLRLSGMTDYVFRRTNIKIFIKSLFHSSLLVVILRDFFRIKYNRYSDRDHLAGAMKWLCMSQDITGCGGCSATYSFERGWTLPYPETTGYIISTFIKYSIITGDDAYLERARQMGDWEIDIQLPSGAVRGGSGINDYPIVFNTGMVILGWADLYEFTKDTRYLTAARRAADWLCSVIDTDGRWSRFTYNDIPHAYHSRVAWALLEVYKHTADSVYKDVARKNLNWVLSLVQGNGWIEEMGFYKGEIPLTHTIVYTLRGLLESSAYFEEDLKLKIREVVMKASERLMLKYELNKRHPNATPDYFAGRFNDKWQPKASFTCLTGDAQLAIVWIRIYQMNQDARFLNGAIKMIDQIKELQNLNSKNNGIKGGIRGSYPVWGNYMPYSYPNWAAKFFADAIMLQEEVMNKLEK